MRLARLVGSPQNQLDFGSLPLDWQCEEELSLLRQEAARQAGILTSGKVTIGNPQLLPLRSC